MAAYTYSTAYGAAAGGDASFVQRCIASAVKLAEQVYSEAPATAGHANRALYATKVLNDPQAYGLRFALIAVMDATIFASGSQVATTDGQIDNAISAAWNALAGV